MHRLTPWILLLALLALACSAPLLGAPATPTATLPPSATLTPELDPLPTPTLTPIPLPTPTPLPGVRIAAGDLALFEGDWEAALSAYQDALSAAPSMEQR